MGEPDTRTDEQLMHACAAGDTAAFEALLRRYERRILAYAYRTLGDYDAARDIFQQTFLNIYEKRARYRETARFVTYAYRIAHNLCQNEVRRRARRRHASLEHPGTRDEEKDLREALPAEGPSPVEPLTRDEEDRLLREALDRLEPVYREVIALRIFEGLPFDEIADVTGTNPSTAKSRLRYALGHLERAIRGKLRPET